MNARALQSMWGTSMRSSSRKVGRCHTRMAPLLLVAHTSAYLQGPVTHFHVTSTAPVYAWAEMRRTPEKTCRFCNGWLCNALYSCC